MEKVERMEEIQSTVKKGLSSDAYIYNPDKEYEPYMSHTQITPEFTTRAIVIGIILSIVFGAANAYLALQIGMTICASIPAAVIGMAILKGGFKNGTILENNMIQTVGSSGEALAAGVAFTLPALLLMSLPVNAVIIFVVAAVGGILGVLLMIPLRKYLIVEEHGKLPYPEGTACAEVIVAGHEGGSSAKMLFTALGLGAFYKFCIDGLGVLPCCGEYAFDGQLKGGGVGMDFLPSLLGAGFLVGPKIAAHSLAGSVIGWFVIMPLIYFVGSHSPDIIFPSTELIADMDMWGIWSKYLRYVGIGAVIMGGLISLIRSIPIIVRSFKGTFASYKISVENRKRTEENMAGKFIIIGTIVILGIIAFLPVFPNAMAGSVGAILVLILGFFFVTVSSHIVGLVGSSSNPIVAMTIGGLLLTAIIFRAFGFSGTTGMLATIVVGSIICIAAGVCGDMSQDLKTGYLLGATPKKQQYGQIIGVLASAAVIGTVIIMLNQVYGIGSERLPAPHANMIKVLAEGVMTGNLPWSLLFMGMGISVAVFLLGGSILPFAVGLYLPISLSIPMMIGGIIRGIVEKKKYDTETRNKKLEKGTLYASGLIAGDALMGVIVTALIYVGVDMTGLLPSASEFVGFLTYSALCCFFAWIIFSKKYEDTLQGHDLKM